MITYKYDEETQQIVRISGGKKDSAMVLLGEGRFSTDLLKRLHRRIIAKLKVVDEKVGVYFRARMMNKMHVVPNRITFGAFQENYADNCKYIAEKIIERGLDYEMIFIVKKDVYQNKDLHEIPPQIRLVKRNSMESFYALATSKFWFDNALLCIWKKIPKKKEQIYINTWHGSLGIKRLSGNDGWIKVARSGDKLIDYFMTDSVFDEKVFSESFWPNVKHMKFGHPRNDILFDEERMKAARKKVYEFYDIPEHAKTVMYGPTFRDNKSDVSAIDVDFEQLKNALEKRFGGEWYVLNRLHFHNAKSLAARSRGRKLKYVKNASDYRDMMELIAATDVGITDYSSWIFDYLFTGRPAFIYAADIEQYRNDRGFYYSLDETPFQIADTNQKLAENVLAFDQAEFDSKVKEFLKEKGCYEAGNACDRVVDFIVKHTK